MEKILVSLPDDLLRRMKTVIPARKRSQVVKSSSRRRSRRGKRNCLNAPKPSRTTTRSTGRWQSGIPRRETGLNLKRGDVYWVDLNPTVGSEIKKQRPCVLIGATPINQARRTVLIIPLSSSGTPRPPLAIEVECLGRKVVAVCDQLRAVDKSRLREPAGALGADDLEQIEEALRRILSL